MNSYEFDEGPGMRVFFQNEKVFESRRRHD